MPYVIYSNLKQQFGLAIIYVTVVNKSCNYTLEHNLHKQLLYGDAYTLSNGIDTVLICEQFANFALQQFLNGPEHS